MLVFLRSGSPIAGLCDTLCCDTYITLGCHFYTGHLISLWLLYCVLPRIYPINTIAMNKYYLHVLTYLIGSMVGVVHVGSVVVVWMG